MVSHQGDECIVQFCHQAVAVQSLPHGVIDVQHARLDCSVSCVLQPVSSTTCGEHPLCPPPDDGPPFLSVQSCTCSMNSFGHEPEIG